MVETTVEIANKVGVSEVISRIVEGLKDDNEPYRRMVMETIEQVGVCTYEEEEEDEGKTWRGKGGGILMPCMAVVGCDH